MNKIKIAIVDDHQLFRDGIHSLLSKNDDFEILISSENGKDFFDKLKSGNLPEIVLLDLTMPEMNGFEVLIKLKKKYPNIKAIAISMHDDGNYIMQSIRAGAYGYLLKNADEEELLKAIDTVLNGNKYFNQEISQKMINIMSLEGVSPKKLSPKEMEILKLIAEGHTTKEIAQNLFISTRTVETHRNNMMKKLEVKNTPELINKASQLKLL
ncbi:response regulator [Cyclobacterium amurskyense]|uniref:Two component transcriptional regulator, LuxR family n=1 Tax=Cyclobacterium amurskyense TaxID=320787 RepID=A0A0H4PKJ7_9BACT|nr:response regulator transcription factor [Cyclobacterium amurskyense]AKP53518.1 Two component transcriptional regulator, LuxR family [Cyclobacterium amurskyense]|tara:strand:- start:10989 stop:11621 length:633 start_codon:yes stop_codon:yes gene_type:complete